MRRLAIVVAAAAMFVGFAAYTTRPPRYDWQVVRSFDGRFQITTPSQAAFSDPVTLDTVDGSKFVSHRLTASPQKDVIFAVAWWENPSQLKQADEELFQHLRQCALNAFHGTIVGEASLSVSGYAAKQFQIAGKDFYVANRLVRAGTRVYSVWVIEPMGEKDLTAVNKFLDSFSLAKS